MIGARECSRRLSHRQSHLCRRGSRGRCVETCPRPSPAHVWTEVWLPSVWACITRSPKEKWFKHDLIRQNKRQEWSSGERERERGWEEQGCLEGATAKASADVLEIRIWEVNTSNWGGEGWKEGRKGREGGRKGGKWEGGKFTVEGRKEMNMYGW